MSGLHSIAVMTALVAGPFLAFSAEDLALRAAERARAATGRPAPQPVAATGRGNLQIAAARVHAGGDGGAGNWTDRPVSTVVAPSFVRIAIDGRGIPTFEGIASPGTEVRLDIGGKVVGTARTDAGGTWNLSLPSPLSTGDHRIASSAMSLDQSRVLVGQEVRIAIPDAFAGSPIVAYEAPQPVRAASDLDQQRQRAEDLAAAATEKFSEVVPERPKPSPSPSPRLAQAPPAAPPAAPKSDGGSSAASKPPPAAQKGAPPDRPSDITAPVVDWLERSARDYQGIIVKGLSQPQLQSGAGASAKAPDLKPVAPTGAAPSAPPAASPSDGGIGAMIGSLQSSAEEWLAKANRDYQTEIVRKLEAPQPGGAGSIASQKAPQPSPTSPAPPADPPAAKSAADADAKLKAAAEEDQRKRVAAREAEEAQRREAIKRAEDAKRAADAAKSAPKPADAAKSPPVADGKPSPSPDAAAKTAQVEAAKSEAAKADATKAEAARRLAEEQAKAQAEDLRRRNDEFARQKARDEADRQAADARKQDEQRIAEQKRIEDEAKRAREAADRAQAEREKAQRDMREAEARRDADRAAAEAARKLASEARAREGDLKAAQEAARKAEESRLAADGARRAMDAQSRAAQIAAEQAARADASAKAADLAQKAVAAARSGPAKREAERLVAAEARRVREAASMAIAAEADGARRARSARTTRPRDNRIAEGSAERGPVDTASGKAAEKAGRGGDRLDRSERSGLGAGVRPPAAATGRRDTSDGRATHREGCARAGRSIDPPGTYVVGRGDTLWEIAERHYRNGERYRRIVRANRGKIDDPDVIEPCQRIYLP